MRRGEEGWRIARLRRGGLLKTKREGARTYVKYAVGGRGNVAGVRGGVLKEGKGKKDKELMGCLIELTLSYEF